MDAKTTTDSSLLGSTKLWDEMLKAIVAAMPSQLFPLFKELYGKEYPKDTSIVLLGSETSSFQENGTKPPDSTLMDIALLVAGTDYYHLECQMKNDSEMVIRMFAYDVRFAITHSKEVDGNTGEFTLYFPHSAVIYPEKNNAIPDYLKCRVVFQDGTEHIYKIPTVRIQTYTLREIREKHLALFIPYAILRLRPRLRKNVKRPLTQKELTSFVAEAILVLEEELAEGNLTEREYYDYVRLFRFAADQVLAKHPKLQEEVHHMTEPLIKLPSMIQDELWARIADQEAEIADRDAKLVDREAEIADQKAEIADQKAEIADQKAEIQRLRELVNQLSAELS